MARSSPASLVALALVLALVLALPSSAVSGGPALASFPAAGTLTATVRARALPDANSRVVALVHEFRPDYSPTIVFATGAAQDASGRWWYHLRLAGRPNGRLGWIPAVMTDGLAPVRARIVVDVSARTLRLYRAGRLLMTTRVAVGKPQAPTPLGHFYVSARYVPDNGFLGVYALETSAYSRLSDWPGGGIVGLHGTYLTRLLGQAVSHGCVRLANAAVLVLKRQAPLGTEVDIVA